MLHTQTVSPGTLELLKELMSVPELEQFALVGGTNLSLKLGHRISIDIDMFTSEPFDLSIVNDSIRRRFHQSLKLDESKQTLLYSINDVKTGLILHEYPLLEAVENMEGIRLLSLNDIIPMKLGAISGRGAKKDFWDIAALLDTYDIQDMIELYKRKYTSDDIGFIVRSLTYFDDAELQTDPVSLNDMTWIMVKQNITNAVREYIDTKIK